MKRKIFFLISLVGLVILVASFARFLSTRGPKLGQLRIVSTPDANIFIDNENAGKTPYKEKYKVGEYTVKLIPVSAVNQLVSWQGKITIGKNLLTYINANLSESELTTAVDVVWLEKITSKQSELSVTTSPDGSTVLVDDVVKGVSPLSLQDLSAGEHLVSITNRGFQTRLMKIVTTPGYRLITNFKLALDSNAPPSEPSASATPSGTITGKTTPTPKSPSGGKTATASATKQPDPARPFVIIKDTPTGFLRVRMEPTTGATEAARVDPGDKFTIIDSQSGWYEISYDGVNSGWVSGQYTEKVQ